MENAARTMATKRLAFAIFCSERKWILNQISSLQEKVVELFRMSASPALPEIFLLLRILLFKIGPENFIGLWPTIITEIVHLHHESDFRLIFLDIALSKPSELFKGSAT